jgi:hypothetical protein
MMTWKQLEADVPRLLPAAVLAGLVFGLDLLGKFGNAVGVLYVAPVLLVGFGIDRLKPFVIAFAGVCSALTVAGYAFASPQDVVGVALANRALSLLAIWLTASLCLFHLRVEGYGDDGRKFLPICASCKKIRDEEGRWTHLESYFSEQFAVRFTHGICPDCVRELYPAVVKKHLHYSDLNLARRPSTPKPAPGPLAG